MPNEAENLPVGGDEQNPDVNDAGTGEAVTLPVEPPTDEALKLENDDLRANLVSVTAERDAALDRVEALEAHIATMDREIAPVVLHPDDSKIKRLKRGQNLDDKPVLFEAVRKMIDDRRLFQVALLDAESCVAWSTTVVAADLAVNPMFERVTVNRAIDLAPELDAMDVTGAALVTAKGNAVGFMRMSAPLPAGGGNRAQLQVGALAFDFEAAPMGKDKADA